MQKFKLPKKNHYLIAKFLVIVATDVEEGISIAELLEKYREDGAAQLLSVKVEELTTDEADKLIRNYELVEMTD